MPQDGRDVIVAVDEIVFVQHVFRKDLGHHILVSIPELTIGDRCPGFPVAEFRCGTVGIAEFALHRIKLSK